MQELFKILNIAKNTLDDYYELHKADTIFSQKNSPRDYLEWVDKKLELLLILPILYKNLKSIYFVVM